MAEFNKTYEHSTVEQKLYDRWIERGYFRAEVDVKDTTTRLPPTCELSVSALLLYISATIFLCL